jgi:limonene-1,2-epoxide hydrolase
MQYRDFLLLGISESINQSINPLMNQLINQSINQSTWYSATYSSVQYLVLFDERSKVGTAGRKYRNKFRTFKAHILHTLYSKTISDQLESIRVFVSRHDNSKLADHQQYLITAMSIDSVEDVNFKKLFKSVDEMDMESILSFMAEDVTFRYGSMPAVKGHEDMRAGIEGFYTTIAALQHDLQRTIKDGNTVVCEGESTYTRHNGSKITLPFCNVFEVAGGLISLYRIYIDIGPVYASSG